MVDTLMESMAHKWCVDSRPRVLAVLPSFIPSTILAVVKPLTALHRAGQIVADITLETRVSRRKIEGTDVIIFSRNTEPIYGYVLNAALALGKPVIYDIDDNFFEIPPFSQSGPYHLAPERLAQLQRYLKTANLVRVYSDQLRECVEQLNPYVIRVDGLVDWNLLPPSRPPRDPRFVRIVYATSRTAKDDLTALFMDDVRYFLTTHRGRVELFFWGYHPPELRTNPSVHFLDFVRDYDRFFRRFAGFGFDVGLAPLRDDVFHRSKSNTKFREYAACRIAGVYSNVDVYSADVTDGQTGLLVSNEPGGWFRALSRLIEDAKLRKNIQERAYLYVRERYGLEKAQKVWLGHLHLVLASTRNSCSMGQESPMTHGSSVRDRSCYPSSAFGRAGLPRGSFIRLVQRGVGLLRHMETRGVMATVNLVRWHLYEIHMLVRLKWNLLPGSHRWFWRKITNVAPCSRPPNRPL